MDEVEGTFSILVNFQAVVQFKGTRTNADEHANDLAAHIEVTCRDAGIKTIRRQQQIRLLPSGVISDDADSVVSEAGAR